MTARKARFLPGCTVMPMPTGDIATPSSIVTLNTLVLVSRTSGFPLYTVDFIKSYNNAYKMMTLRPGTPKPSPQVLLGKVSANLLADGLNTMKISFTGKFYPVYGMANDIANMAENGRARHANMFGRPSRIGGISHVMAGVGMALSGHQQFSIQAKLCLPPPPI